MEEVVKKKSKGKHKIKIEAIKNKTQLQVTFSKRRTGLFKKGSELCTLCGPKIAIVTFSPAGKLFSFGHPSAEAVIQRYINNANNYNNYGNNDNISFKSVQEYMDVRSQIEAEKRASTSSSNNSNNGRDYGRFWWDKNIDDLGLVDLQHFKIALEGLRDEVLTRVDQINRLSMSLVPQNFEFGSRDGNTVAHSDNFNESGRLIDQSLMSLVPHNLNVGTRDGNTVAHCKSVVDGSTAGPWIDQSSMSVVPHNFEFGTRDDNTVAHCKIIDGSTSGLTDDQSLMSLVVGTRDGNNVAHYQGFDESSTHWIDQGAGRDEFHHGSRPVYSFHDMLVKKED